VVIGASADVLSACADVLGACPLFGAWCLCSVLGALQGACAVVRGACFGGSAVSSFTAASNTALYSACIHGDGQVIMKMQLT